MAQRPDLAASLASCSRHLGRAPWNNNIAPPHYGRARASPSSHAPASWRTRLEKTAQTRFSRPACTNHFREFIARQTTGSGMLVTEQYFRVEGRLKSAAMRIGGSRRIVDLQCRSIICIFWRTEIHGHAGKKRFGFQGASQLGATAAPNYPGGLRKPPQWCVRRRAGSAGYIRPRTNSVKRAFAVR